MAQVVGSVPMSTFQRKNNSHMTVCQIKNSMHTVYFCSPLYWYGFLTAYPKLKTKPVYLQ